MAKKHRVTRVVSNKKKNKNRRHSPNSRANESQKTDKNEPPQTGNQSQTKTSSNKNSKSKKSTTKEDESKEIEVNSPDDECHDLSPSPIQFEWIPSADFLPSAYTPSQINDHIDALHSDNVQIGTTSAAITTRTISIDVNHVAGQQLYPPPAPTILQPSETAVQSPGIIFLQETQLLEGRNAASASAYTYIINVVDDPLSSNENIIPETDRQSPHQDEETNVLSFQVASEVTQNIDNVPTPGRDQTSHTEDLPVPETFTQSDNSNKPDDISDNIRNPPEINVDVPTNRGEESPLNTVPTHPQQNMNVPIKRGEESPLNAVPTHSQQNMAEIQPQANNDKFLTHSEQITLSQTRVQSRVLDNVVNSDWNYVPNKESTTTTGCPKPTPDNPQYGVRHLGERRSNNRPTARLCQNGRYLYPISETPEHPAAAWSPELSWNKEPQTLRAITKQRHDGEQNAAQIHNEQAYHHSLVTNDNNRIPESKLTRHELPPNGNGIISQTNASYSHSSQIVQQGNTAENHLHPQKVFQDGTVIINSHGERLEPWRAPVTSSSDFNTTTTPPPIINQDKNSNNYVLPQQLVSRPPPPLHHHHQQAYTIPPPTYNQINQHLQHQQQPSSIPQLPPTYRQIISPPPYHLQHPHDNNGIVVSQQPPPTYSPINHPPPPLYQQPSTSPQPQLTYDQINQHLQHQQSSSIQQPPPTYSPINHPPPPLYQQPSTSPQPPPMYNQTSPPPYHLHHPQNNNGIVASQQQPIPNHHPTPVARPSMPNTSSRPPPTPPKTDEFAFFPSSSLDVSPAMRAYSMARSNGKFYLPGRCPPCSYAKDRLRRSPRGIYPEDPRDLYYDGEYFKIVSPKPNEICDCCFALWCHEMTRAFQHAGFQPPARDYAHGLYCLARLEGVRCPHHGELQQIQKSEEWTGNPFPEASQRTLENIVEQLTEMEIITRTFHRRYQVESG